MSPAPGQALQVLQDGEFSRLGGDVDVHVDVRVLAATNRNLEDMVRKAAFREDLYYRLNVVNVWIPPLRERREEIPVLVDHFRQLYSAKYGRDLGSISDRLMRGFIDYPWPGNVRELENMVKRIVVLQSEDADRGRDFGAPAAAARTAHAQSAAEADPRFRSTAPSRWDIGRRAARDAEREAPKRVLYQTNWNRKKACPDPEVSYKTLLQKIKECGLGE